MTKADENKVPVKDREILRELAKEYAELAALPVHEEKAALWRKLNRLKRTRPMIYINEIPWGEMNVNGELDLVCEMWAVLHILLLQQSHALD